MSRRHVIDCRPITLCRVVEDYLGAEIWFPQLSLFFLAVFPLLLHPSKDSVQFLVVPLCHPFTDRSHIWCACAPFIVAPFYSDDNIFVQMLWLKSCFVPNKWSRRGLRFRHARLQRKPDRLTIGACWCRQVATTLFYLFRMKHLRAWNRT